MIQKAYWCHVIDDDKSCEGVLSTVRVPLVCADPRDDCVRHNYIRAFTRPIELVDRTPLKTSTFVVGWTKMIAGSNDGDVSTITIHIEDIDLYTSWSMPGSESHNGDTIT